LIFSKINIKKKEDYKLSCTNNCLVSERISREAERVPPFNIGVRLTGYLILTLQISERIPCRALVLPALIWFNRKRYDHYGDMVM